ncbi:MAG TPA: hypothetical protein VF146_15870 [Bryobacteraceae bacterium]
MKKIYLMLPMLCAVAFAQGNTVVRWRGMEGVITAPGVDNPIGQVHSGAGPWTAKSGNAQIDLASGEGFFDVEHLVLNGGASSGTPGGVTTVVGTLVCNAGSPAGSTETVVDTPATSLSSGGDAELSFRINVPAECNNPLFLIRTASGRWLATGTRSVSSSGVRDRY